MANSLSNLSEKAGMPPGSLVHVGDVHELESRITLIDYSKENIEEKTIQSADDIMDYKDSDTVTWVIVEGLTNIDIVENIGKILGIHPLVLEDILNTHQRPKFEEYDNYLYVVLKSLLSENDQFTVAHEQISLLVLKNFVVAFKEKTDDLFYPVQQRIRTSKGRFRSFGADYLTYAILDTIVDRIFILIDSLDDAVTTLEDSILSSESRQDSLNTIQRLKREIIGIRRYTSPLRDLMAGLLRSESDLVHENTHIYLRDVSDHAIRVIESIESYREILSGLLEIYISSVSNKMNEVMKVLTVFASIFIPLTFLVGIYGMNFEYMPELKWKWAYPTLWVVFISIPVILLIYFKKRKWL